jgi:hypothetical protein
MTTAAWHDTMADLDANTRRSHWATDENWRDQWPHGERANRPGHQATTNHPHPHQEQQAEHSRRAQKPSDHPDEEARRKSALTAQKARRAERSTR